MGRIESTSDKRFFQGFCGQLMIGVSNAKEFSDNDWTEYCKMVERVATESGPYIGAIAYVLGAPDANQRRVQRDLSPRAMNDMKYAAMLTDSALVRGAGTAMSWLNVGLKTKMYKPSEYNEAFTWIREFVQFDPNDAILTFKEMIRITGTPPIG